MLQSLLVDALGARAYQHGDVAALGGRYVGSNRAKLTPEQTEQVKAYLQQSLTEALPDDIAHQGGAFWTVANLRVAVKYWFGVTWKNDSSYRDLLYRCGFSYHKAQTVGVSVGSRGGLEAGKGRE